MDPYPRSFVALCKAYLAQGRYVAAMAAARRGLERFPYSEDLRDVLRHTWRQTRAAEIDALRRRCDEDGTPEPFEDLVRIYLECEEYDEALAVAEELARRHPNVIVSWLLQGEVLLNRFYKDHVAGDARRAIMHLKRALEIDEQDFLANYLLTRIYHYIGAVSKALFHLYRALDVDPDHDGARNLYEELSERPLESEEEGSLLRLIEESEAPMGRAEGDGMSPERRAALRADLDRLSLLNGVTRAAFVSTNLTVVAERGESRVVEDVDEDPLCRIARGFRQAAAISAKRMGIGAFQSAILNAGDHMLQFHAVGHTVVLVESEDPSRIDVVKAECVNFVASCLRNAEDLVHA